MDTKLTLSFDAAVADRAKANNISLSRLVEFKLNEAISGVSVTALL